MSILKNRSRLVVAAVLLTMTLPAEYHQCEYYRRRLRLHVVVLLLVLHLLGIELQVLLQQWSRRLFRLMTKRKKKKSARMNLALQYPRRYSQPLHEAVRLPRLRPEVAGAPQWRNAVGGVLVFVVAALLVAGDVGAAVAAVEAVVGLVVRVLVKGHSDALVEADRRDWGDRECGH